MRGVETGAAENHANHGARCGAVRCGYGFSIPLRRHSRSLPSLAWRRKHKAEKTRNSSKKNTGVEKLFAHGERHTRLPLHLHKTMLQTQTQKTHVHKSPQKKHQTLNAPDVVGIAVLESKDVARPNTPHATHPHNPRISHTAKQDPPESSLHTVINHRSNPTNHTSMTRIASTAFTTITYTLSSSASSSCLPTPPAAPTAPTS